MLDVRLSESTPLVEAASGTPKNRRFRARLIEGDVQGSSGYYPSETLRRDGPVVFKAGTHVYADHPSMTEAADRPERSIKDLAGRLATDATYDGDGLYAEVEVFPHYAPVIEGMADAIGMSIRAFGTAEVSTQEGIRGPVITSLTEGISVDFVTAAGAGGKIVALLESARAARRTEVREGRNVGGWFESRIHSSFTMQADDMYGQGRLSREERIALSSAIGDGLDAFTKRVEADQPQLYQRDIYDEPDGDATLSEARRQVLREGHGMTARDLGSALGDAVRAVYGGEDMWTWVRDHTDDWAVFSVEDDNGDCDLYQQNYTVDEGTGAVTLTGEPVEVRARTTYVPAPPTPDEPQDPSPGPTDEPVTENAPGNPPADPTQIKEGSMPELTDEQARQLEEAATTRTQLDEATTRLSEATTALEQTTSRVTDLETRLAESDTRAQRLENDRTARARVTEALATSGLPEISHSKVAESVCRALPTVDGGGLDDTALTESITKTIDAEKTYVAALAEASGAGAPRGLGAAPEPLAEADIDAQLVKEFAEMGLSESAAKTAASGR